MSDHDHQALQVGDRLPFLWLPSAHQGTPQPLRAQRGFAPIVLLLHATDCALCGSYVELLTAACRELREWGAQVVTVSEDWLQAVTQWHEQREPNDAPMLALADAEQRMPAHVGPPGLLIADQWGVIYFAEHAGEEHQFPSPAEVVNWARFIGIQCPECQAEAL
jgi:peroxiredoxin